MKLEAFKRELDFIQDENIRSFVENALEKADAYFYAIPASTTGNHHPPFDNELGGLVKHSKVVACITNDLCTAKEIDSETKDVLVAAAILHDVKKLGNGKAGYTAKDHPECAVEFVSSLDHENFPKFDLFCRAILTHMGQWGTKKPQNDIEYIVHTADYIASRNTLLNYDFDGYEFSDEILGDIVIPFGKHKGKTIAELEKSYLKWVIDKKDFFSPVYKTLINAYYVFVDKAGSETVHS